MRVDENMTVSIRIVYACNPSKMTAKRGNCLIATTPYKQIEQKKRRRFHWMRDYPVPQCG